MEDLLKNLKLEYIMLVLIIVPLVIGMLLGMLRGSRRAALRLVLVLLCVVAAFCLRGVVTNAVLSMPVDGQTLEQAIISQLPEDAAQLGDNLMPIVRLLVTVVLFLSLFFVIKFISWVIIYPLCKLFVKKARIKKDGTRGKKHALIGGVIGLVQGAAVAVVLCFVFNGLLVHMGNLMESVDVLQQSSNGGTNASIVMTEENAENGGSGTENGGLSADMFTVFNDYKQSGISQTINKIGGDKAFNMVASVKTEDGKTLTLTGQLDAINAMVKMVKELVSLNNKLNEMSDQLKGGLNGDITSAITDVFNALDDICVNMTDESKETVNGIVQTLAGNLDIGVEVDMSVLDFTTISFKNEGQVITSLTEYKDKDFSEMTAEQAEQEAKEIVNLVMESNIILPMLSANSDFTVGLTDVNHDLAAGVIEDLERDETADQKKVDMLKKFFGLSEGSAEGDNGGQNP